MTKVFYCRRALLQDGWAEHVTLTVDTHGTITSISRDTPLATSLAPESCRLNFVIPGMPNVHSHSFQRGMAGLAEQAGPTGDSFWTWRNLMYRFVRILTIDDMVAITRWLCVELLSHGYTSLGEFHYLHHQPDGQPYEMMTEVSEAIIETVSGTGMRLTHLPALYSYAGFDRSPPVGGQARFTNSVDDILAIQSTLQSRYANHDSVRIGLAAHSLRAVDQEQLRHLVSVVEADPRGRLHLHVAEQTAEVNECLAHYGARPVRWLLDNFALSHRWCLIHATHLDASETADLARTCAVVGLCPTTEANLGDGIFPVVEFLNAGGCFSIGSDSHVCVSPVDELRWLEYGQRLQRQSRNVLATTGPSTGRSLYSTAAKQGAVSLGWATGMIAEGCLADLIELDTQHPLLVARDADQILDTYVFCGGRDMIESVWVGGHRVAGAGQHAHETLAAHEFRQFANSLPNRL